MSRRINNARPALMQQGRLFLMNNQDGRLGKFNLREFTAQCGMASGTFYRYFKSKDYFVIQIMESDLCDVMDEISGVSLREIPLYDKVKIIYEKVAEFERRYYLSAMSLLSPSQENMARRRRNEQLVYDLLSAFLKAEIERGELSLSADCDTAAYLLIQLFVAAARKPDIGFDELWRCMNFTDSTTAGNFP